MGGRGRQGLRLPPRLQLSSPFPSPALQSPIEYQRRESQTNSLGRPGGPGVGSPGRMRPGDLAQVSMHTPVNGSLPSLLLLPKGEVPRAPLPLDVKVRETASY